MLGVVAAYSYYANGLPSPEAALADLDFDQQTIVFDRDGIIELARLGERKREIVTFGDLTPEVLDATTAIEDKDFWVNPGFDTPASSRRPSTRSMAGPRRLDDHPAARPGACCRRAPSRAAARSGRSARSSSRPTQAYPSEEGKQEIITAYLNQNFYGNQSYR